jgi:multicomponent Na+:H+ antiporter subunit G
MRILGGILMVLGAVFALLAGVGVLRFRDTYARMHAAAKASTLGVAFVALGAALHLGSLAGAVVLTLVVVLQFLTAPVGAHLLGSGIHRHEGSVSDVDELADVEDDQHP